MKKISIILAALGLFISSATMAIPEESVASSVKKAFHTSFSNAKKVKWDKIQEFYFVTFLQNEKEISVAYNEQGEVMGSSEMISYENLPVLTQIALHEQYGRYTRSPQVYSITCNGLTDYFVTAVNEKRLLKLKCSEDGGITVIQSTKLKKQ